MKSTGIVRKLDLLGRISIPIALRRPLNFKEHEPVEIFLDEDKVILKKYQPQSACIITGDVSPDNMQFGKGIILSPEGAKILLQQLQEIKK